MNQKSRPKKKMPGTWAKVDWRLQNREIVDLTGASPSAVSRARAKLGEPRPANWHQTKNHGQFLAKWTVVDWKKPNVVIAREMKVSRERVRQIRENLGIPKPGSKSASRKARR